MSESTFSSVPAISIARQETELNPRAVSRAGARGLMQMMPATAKATARSVGQPYDIERLTADPEYNILLGRHYLRTLLERYDGEVVLAMSAYNAGPSRVEEWLGLNGDPRRGELHDLVAHHVASMVLLPLVCSQVDVPVIAAGGICDGRSKAAAFLLGAEGVQMGTRMLSSEESPVHANYKQAVLDAPDPAPPPPGHRLWSAPGLLISPHVGGSSAAFEPRARRLLRAQLERFAAGEPLANVVVAPPE